MDHREVRVGGRGLGENNTIQKKWGVGAVAPLAPPSPEPLHNHFRLDLTELQILDKIA